MSSRQCGEGLCASFFRWKVRGEEGDLGVPLQGRLIGSGFAGLELIHRSVPGTTNKV